MYLSVIWLCLAFILLHDHHPITSLAVFNVFLLHRLWEVKNRKKPRQKS